MRRIDFTIAATLLASVLLASFPVPAQAQSTMPSVESQANPEALRLVGVWLDSEEAYRQIPALSVAIVQGDKTVLSTGYGALDAARRVPATGRTLYPICSISKLFASVALMQLWEAGRVRLDDTVTTYLPWAKLAPVGQDSVPITLRAMLSHSAGLPRDFDVPYWTGPDFSFPSEEQLKTTLSQISPPWPASRWLEYGNVGPTLIGYTVSAISGQSYEDYVRAHILEPLGMTDTYPSMPMSLYGKRLAVGWGAITREGKRELLAPFDARGLSPVVGYTSTAEDLSRFATWQFRLLRTGTTEVLKPSTLREMQRVQFLDPDWKDSWGLGFEVARRDNQTYVGHDGSCPGYNTALSLRPATETAVSLLFDGMENAVSHAAAVFDILDKRKNSDSTRPPSAEGVDLEAFTGRYSGQPWKSEVVIVPWAGGLALLRLPSSAPAGDLVILKAKGGDVFRRLRDDGSESEEVRFERDRSGKANRFVEFGNPHSRIADLPSLASPD